MDPEERGESMKERRAEKRNPSLEAKETINIKPQNRGKFTRYAKGKGESVQTAAHKVVESKTASTKLKREAQFAINAKKFKH
jgi:hypothetical protein